MSLAQVATRAYQAAAENRSIREQEAELFRHVNGLLRNSVNATPATRSRAIAENKRLWSLVSILVSDESNQLPAPLRAGILSLGIAVRRELDNPEPDLDFVTGINEQIAAGLSGQH